MKLDMKATCVRKRDQCGGPCTVCTFTVWSCENTLIRTQIHTI